MASAPQPGETEPQPAPEKKRSFGEKLWPTSTGKAGKTTLLNKQAPTKMKTTKTKNEKGTQSQRKEMRFRWAATWLLSERRSRLRGEECEYCRRAARVF